MLDQVVHYADREKPGKRAVTIGELDGVTRANLGRKISFSNQPRFRLILPKTSMDGSSITWPRSARFVELLQDNCDARRASQDKEGIQ